MDHPGRLEDSLQSAEAAVVQRLLDGTGKVIEKVPQEGAFDEDRLLSTVTREIESAVEVLDRDALSAALKRFQKDALAAPGINGLAASVPDSGGVVVVPAFTGLGAPYWDMYARGAVLGITRGTDRGHLARAVLECIAYQVTDLMLAMRQDAGCDITMLRADGGASVSDILLQMQADLLRIPVDRPEMVETTAFGAAALAGLSCGLWRDMEELRTLRRSQRVFLPQGTQADCDRNYRLWKRAVSRAADWIEH